MSADVVDAWVEPDAARNRLLATENGETSCEVEPRSGETYKITRIKNGRRNVGVGEYLRVDLPDHLSLTFSMRRFDPEFDTNTVEFSPSGGGTEFSLALDGLRLGYQEATLPVGRGMFGGL